MDYVVDGIICMEEEDINSLRKIFPDMSLDELYAVHYIHSRRGLCSWMCIAKSKKDIENYCKEYEEKIKPYLTQDIIDVINHCGSVGSDSVEWNGKGYNLDVIFSYAGLNTEPTFEPKEPTGNFSMGDLVDFITESYSRSILPYICKGV